jgi:uncharacterized protein involved in exopolysaccharide biosynthesis
MIEASDGADRSYPDVEREGLRPLREHRAFISVFILSALLSALVLTYVYSERYRAEVIILFRPSDVMRLGTHAIQALGSPFPNTPFKAITQTIFGLVASDELLERVVNDLHLDRAEPRDVSGPWYIRSYKELKYALQDYGNDAWMFLKWGRIIEEDPVHKAVTELRKQVKVRNDDSYLYSLQVTAKTPQRAAAIADDVAFVLADLLQRDDQRSVIREGQERRALGDAKSHEIEGIEERMRDLLASNQIASIQEEINKTTERASKLQGQLTDTTADLRQGQAKVAGLAERLRVRGPQTSNRDEDSAPVPGLSRITAEDYAKLTSKKLDAEVEATALRSRLNSFEQSYAALMPRIQALDQIAAQYDLMSAQLTNAKRDFTTLTDASQETVIRATSAQTELRIQAQAVIPDAPVSPIKIYHVLGAGLLAAMIVIGLAYVLDYFTIRLFLPPAGGRRRRREPSRALAPTPETAAARLTVE